jgi:hypothetical protein
MKDSSKSAGKGGSDGGGFRPTREWIQALRAQWTKALIEDAERYAAVQARKVAFVRVVEKTYPAELVQDVIADTMLGAIRWDPERVPLKKHVLDAIKSRTRHDYKHARKYPHIRIEDLTSVDLEAAFASGTRAADSPHRSMLLLAALRDLARGDQDVTLLLDCYDRRITRKFDVIKAVHLTDNRYRAARGRLERLTLALPANLRPGSKGRP